MKRKGGGLLEKYWSQKVSPFNLEWAWKKKGDYDNPN